MQNVQQLIEDNINLVYFVINTYYPTFRQDEDIIQCGMLGLCRAANAWDEEKGTFSTLATRCIKHEIIREFIRRKRHNNQLSLDYEYHDSNGDRFTLADKLEGDSDVDWVDVNGFRDKLSDTERLIFDMRELGYTGKEIAKRLGCTHQNVTRQLRIMKLKSEGNRWKYK